MEFKNINTREIILISIAGLLIVMTIFAGLKHKNIDAPHDPLQEPGLTAPVLRQPQAVEQNVPMDNRTSMDDEDQGVQKQMKDQMDKDRSQQRQIKMLKMQLEQVNLQLENEKALTQINKLKKENAGYVKDPDSQAGADFPNIRIIYIGGTGMDKEAILSIDGTSYSVKPKDRPVANLDILGITDQGVKVHFSAPQKLTTVINYVQD